MHGSPPGTRHKLFRAIVIAGASLAGATTGCGEHGKSPPDAKVADAKPGDARGDAPVDTILIL